MTLNIFKIKPKISLINKMSAFTERELIQDKKKKRRKEKKAEFWPVRSNTGLS